MVISDLSYLETLSETTDIQGGYFFKKVYQSNYSNIEQYAYSKAEAKAFYDDAYAKSTAYNVAYVGQFNYN
ncbi:hypothetical protein [Leptothermofonsia sp. ETS-13]|uniref:hypothetical protein n=1 Tax=Leptothermofonsia sp. ETS-13 TaxID=3035696 RepID=UPI003BA3BF2F